VSRALSAELLKLRTTRAFFVLALVAIGFEALISVAYGLSVDANESRIGEDLFSVSGLAQIFALIIGILAVTNEYRHGTITPTLLVVPDRARLVGAKLAAALLVGLALGLACAVANVGLGALIVAIRGLDSGVSVSDVAGPLAGSVVAVMLFCGLGVGIGAVVRNQVGAIVGALVWLFVVEPALGAIDAIGDTVAEYGLGGAGSALGGRGFDDGITLDQIPGALLLVGYCALFVAGGIALMRSRDVG
jgi:ABC-2 type transport system permease protein